MTATWDENTDDSYEKSPSFDEDSSKGVVTFVAFTQNDSSSESESECENEESELQGEFDKLFEESSTLEKLVA